MDLPDQALFNKGKCSKDLFNNIKLDLALDLSKFDLDLPDQALFN